MRPGARSLAVLAVAVLVVVLPACGQTAMAQPDCRSDDPDTLVTMAQAVPTAMMVPCLGTLPAGWDFELLEVRDGTAELTIGSDRGGDRALTVTLQRTCRLGDAKRVPSDEAGARRFELVRQLRPYSGVRIYHFRGGCVVYDFQLETDRASALLNEASLMVNFVTRTELRRQVISHSEGVITDAP